MSPKHYLCHNLIRREDGNRPPVPNAGRTLNCASPHPLHFLVNARPAVVVEPCKVQFPQVPRVVHVANENVHIIAGAKSPNCGLLGDLGLLLEEHAVAQGGDASYEVVNIPQRVQDQEAHHEEKHYIVRPLFNDN